MLKILIGIEGELGGGKTLLLVRFLYREYFINHRQILTNLTLNNIPYKQLDVLKLLEDNSELENVVVGIDELTVMVDCRTSSSRSNRFFSYMVLQSRKRNVDIYYTSQNLDMIDHRVIDHTYFIVECSKIYDKNNKLIDNFRSFAIYDLRNARKPTIKRFVLNISPYYTYYNTNQKIMPIYDFKPKKDIQKKV